jgi:pimeloyl-ACP methyl ester carboxylesterase
MKKISSAMSRIAPDGVVIRFSDEGQGDPPIVFVHGWSCDRTYWAAQARHFSKSHRVVCIDLGGHGESGSGRAAWTMEAFGADVASVLDALDLRGAVLVGHSMAGPVVLEAAFRAPERVAALVAVDYFNAVGRPMSDAAREKQLQDLRDDFRGATEAWVRGFFPASTDPALVERIARDMADGPPDVAISALDHLRRYDEASALARTHLPMRLINADLWPTDLEAARRCKPDMQLSVMAGAGHFLFLEEPAEFNRLLARAIQDLCGAAKGGSSAG